MARFIRPALSLLVLAFIASHEVAAQTGTVPLPTPPAFVPTFDQLAAYINESPVFRYVEDSTSSFSKACVEANDRHDYAGVLAITSEWRQASPDSAIAAFNQGTALFYLGNFVEAMSAWKAAAEMPPTLPDLKFSIKEWTGRTQKILDNNPNLMLSPAKWTQGDAYTGRFSVTKQARTLFDAKKWDEIEKVAQSLVQSHIELSDGSWELTWFFGSLWGVPENKETELNWRKRRDAVQVWCKERPKSLLAKLVLARSWVDGAWLARGDQYASKTAPESMKRMDERLAYATSYFKESQALLEKTPMWAGAFQQFSQIAGVDDESYNAIVAAAARRFPTYNNFAVLKSIHLAPRWYGEPGDWEKFAATFANTVVKTRGATEGDISYARIIWEQQEMFRYKDIWHETDASWPRAKRGFQALMRRYPNSLSVVSIACALAGQAHDTGFAHPLLLSRINGQAETFTWKTLDDFIDFRLDVLENYATFRFPMK